MNNKITLEIVMTSVLGAVICALCLWLFWMLTYTTSVYVMIGGGLSFDTLITYLAISVPSLVFGCGGYYCVRCPDKV